ncbi:hypothetical protein, partial [Enterococcus faecium]
HIMKEFSYSPYADSTPVSSCIPPDRTTGLEDPSMNQYNNPYYQQGDRYLDMVTCVGYITDQFQSILFSRTYSYLNENPTCKFYREDVIGPHNT